MRNFKGGIFLRWVEYNISWKMRVSILLYVTISSPKFVYQKIKILLHVVLLAMDEPLIYYAPVQLAGIIRIANVVVLRK